MSATTPATWDWTAKPTLVLFPTWTVVQVGPNETFIVPIEMRFNDGHLISIIVYSILLIVSAIGNITVLCIILKRRRKTRSTHINTMLMHLAIADLLVTFLLMPFEIIWSATVSWWAGDAACKIMAFFRTFGLFQSSFVLVCISIDRYFAVLKPMNICDVDRRGKVLLSGAWIGSIICSLPQIFVFRVVSHPKMVWYEQCLTVWFETQLNAQSKKPSLHEFLYFTFGMIMMYGIPLLVIIFCYASILVEIYRRSREPNGEKFRRSSLGFLSRAKGRTLKMTVIIVFVFFVCWTPYYVMCLWHFIFHEEASTVDQKIQKGLYLFACTNSCMNPLVYGAFNIRTRRNDRQVRQRCASSGTTTCTTSFSISLRNVE
ncbi:adipokinetic hormone/corazonin-related peptide receptor variant I-like isoform X2 [Lycorma delicatula]|uniref:adipokinetic hormone/corazonin-related peptide receptor variant I-like isoform X2 n=1 Tax=Lycorma delicatula TaxID=130591 RepID=UPI003F519348